VLQCAAVCCSVLQCVAVCCSVLQYDAVWCTSHSKRLRDGDLCAAVYSSVLQHLHRSALQCVAPYVAVYSRARAHAHVRSLSYTSTQLSLRQTTYSPRVCIQTMALKNRSKPIHDTDMNHVNDTDMNHVTGMNHVRDMTHVTDTNHFINIKMKCT